MIAAENLDRYLVQVYRVGVCDGTYGDVQNKVYPGDIEIIDRARPFHTFNSDFDNITLTLPRAALAPLLANPDGLHGTVLHRDTAEARLLTAHIMELAASAAKLDTTTGHAVAACLGPAAQARNEIAPRHAAATSETISQYIDRHLTPSALSPDSLTQRFRMSRAQLHRAFPDDGGVQAYIRTQRLRRCFQAIATPAQAGRGIGEIARSVGFVSESHFSRVFHQAFGLKPSEARAQAVAPPAVGAHSFINDRMRQLGRDRRCQRWRRWRVGRRRGGLPVGGAGERPDALRAAVRGGVGGRYTGWRGVRGPEHGDGEGMTDALPVTRRGACGGDGWP